MCTNKPKHVHLDLEPIEIKLSVEVKSDRGTSPVIKDLIDQGILKTADSNDATD